MRVLVLFKQLAGYTSECLRSLQAKGAEVRVVHRAATPDAPFDDEQLTRGLDASSWTRSISDAEVRDALEAFDPDAVLVASWNVGAYRRSMRRWGERSVRVLCMDNQWLGTAKQWAGRLISPVVIRRGFDLAFVPGERQERFAKLLGFSQHQILTGFYCCQTDFFADPSERSPGRGFVFAGRLHPVKGVDVLASGYQIYRAAVTDPWPLLVAGTGSSGSSLSGIEGAEMLGFVGPERLPAVLRDAGCLVLPSRFEPWGVVIHEAAASGLPIICTDACGAASRLVLDGFNGRVIAAGEPRALAAAMQWAADAPPDEQLRRAVASYGLAQQFTPDRWATYLLDRLEEARRSPG